MVQVLVIILFLYIQCFFISFILYLLQSTYSNYPKRCKKKINLLSYVHIWPYSFLVTQYVLHIMKYQMVASL